MWFLVLEAQKSLLRRRRDPASLREESNVTPCSAPRPVQKQNSESPDPEMPRHGMRPWTIVTSAAALIWRVWARDLRHMNAFFFVPALVGTASNTLFETHVLEDNFLFAVLWLTKIEAFVDANIWSDEAPWEVSCRPGAPGDDLANLGGFGAHRWDMRESEQVGVDEGISGLEMVSKSRLFHHTIDTIIWMIQLKNLPVRSFWARSSLSASKHGTELDMSPVARGKPEES